MSKKYFKKQQCDTCKAKVIIVGQAFTSYKCKHCKEEDLHSNTDVPSYCNRCSEKLNICRRCGEPL